MPSPKRRPLVYIVAGCALVTVCALLGAAIAAGSLFSLRGAAASQPAVEYVLDASPRMAQTADTGSGTRLAVAQGVLNEIIRPSDAALTAGLRVFGTGKQAEACTDTDLVVPLARASQTKISSSLLAVTTGPRPEAAMAVAVVAALRDLAGTTGPHTLVVVTGGSDSCNDQAGQLIAAEAKRDGIDYQLFVVGFLVPDDQGSAISGMVDSAGNGHYLNARSTTDLTTILTAIQQHVNDQKANTVSSVLATAAALPTPTATVVPPTATPAPSPTAAFGLTACDNPYFPVRTGASWSYQYDNGKSAVWTVTDVMGDQAQAVAHLTIAGTAGEWQCSAAGIAQNDFPPWFTVNAGQKQDAHDGVWLPAEAQLAAGSSWEMHFTNSYDAGASPNRVHILEAVTESLHYAGAEQITVAGKTYDTIRVEGTRTADFSIPKPSTTKLLYTHEANKLQMWFARGVGMVRFVSAYLEGHAAPEDNFTQELTTFTIP